LTEKKRIRRGLSKRGVLPSRKKKKVQLNGSNGKNKKPREDPAGQNPYKISGRGGGTRPKDQLRILRKKAKGSKPGKKCQARPINGNESRRQIQEKKNKGRGRKVMRTEISGKKGKEDHLGLGPEEKGIRGGCTINGKKKQN